MVAFGVQQGEVGFLLWFELGLFATKSTARLGEFHSLARTHTDEVGFKLGHHRQHVEEKPTDGVVGVVNGATQFELHPASRELVDDVSSVRQRTGESVKLGDDERVTFTTSRERFTKTRTISVSAGESVVRVNAI